MLIEQIPKYSLFSLDDTLHSLRKMKIIINTCTVWLLAKNVAWNNQIIWFDNITVKKRKRTSNETENCFIDIEFIIILHNALYSLHTMKL